MARPEVKLSEATAERVRATATTVPRATREGWSVLAQDFEHFYDFNTLTRLGAGVALAAYLANSSLDQDWQDGLVADTSERHENHFARAVGRPGHYLIALGLLFGTWGSSHALGREADSAEQLWARRSLRSLLVGASIMLPLQLTIGGSRPYEEVGSDWRLFDDTNGVSGHAFVGSIPFLVAGRMSSDPWLRYPLLAASALPAWSRLERNAHYPSQVLLGWWVGWLSVESVFDSVDATSASLRPWIGPDAIGLQWSFEF